MWALDWPNESYFRGNGEPRFFELLIVDRTETCHCSSLVNDIMCFIAVPGIILMIIENELTFVSFDHRETYMTFLLKLIITISTIALLGLIIYYHYLNLKLFCVNNCIQHWYIALTPKRLIQIIAEISICLIHPFPVNFLLTTIGTSHGAPISFSFIPLGVALGLPSKYESCLLAFDMHSSDFQCLLVYISCAVPSRITLGSFEIPHPNHSEVSIKFPLTFSSLPKHTWSSRQHSA